MVLRRVEEGDQHLSFGLIHPDTTGVALQVTIIVLARDLVIPKPVSVSHYDATVPRCHTQVTLIVLARDLGIAKPFSVTHSNANVPWCHHGQPGHPQTLRCHPL